jgi:hypothetical protein
VPDSALDRIGTNHYDPSKLLAHERRRLQIPNTLTITERIPFMNFNIFDLFRTGIKRSILLGVSDAVDVLGVPHGDSKEAVKEKMLGFLKDDHEAPRRIANGTGQKKLGRSLNDIAVATKEAS